jgi:hypothetical protein
VVSTRMNKRAENWDATAFLFILIRKRKCCKAGCVVVFGRKRPTPGLASLDALFDMCYLRPET